MSTATPDAAILDDDYQHAVVDMTCLFHNNACYLVFAAAQLLPAELGAPAEEQPTSHPFKKLKSSGRLVRRRYVVSAKEARTWYCNCLTGEVQLLKGDEKLYHPLHDRLFPEPSWPYLATTEDFVAASDVDGALRVHHLMPRDCPPMMSQLCDEEPAVAAWLHSELGIDFLRHPEQFGSVHLLLPNPVLRNLQIKLHVDKQGAEKAVLRLSPRHKHSVTGLEVMMLEHRPTGISAIHTFTAQGSYLEIPHAGTAEKFELFIRCPVRGVLVWIKDRSYRREVHFNLEATGSTQKAIQVPGKDGPSFNVAIHELVSKHTIGKPSGANGIPARLRKGQYDRQRTLAAEGLGQKWLHRNQEEATNFVRQLIGTARRRVWIIDPYFATAELFSFAAATAYLNTEVMILTGASTALAKPDEHENDKEVGEVMLLNTSQSNMQHIQVRVMTGAMPTVHDRFLVIDDDVWFTGNSLNSLGERAGMMIKLPAPGPVIEKITQVLLDSDRTNSLANWVQHRLATRKPDQCSRFVKLLRWGRKLKRGTLGLPRSTLTVQPSVSKPASKTAETSIEMEKTP
ncbi:VPA1262 family N-terminal domain-containing protein [Pseudomonas citronellolis]|uniref:VPA1262 family N-terminal domain-containing protein n=1 Tax=Pseudomonas citronellolis TaxID=53408 RepID=UPI0021C1D1AC|nr:VPA1262 family N-terminal domain-containing protein [Pseudomonas citronellolis]UXJ50308.1 VPA1262 family N-terminal domain-containing protein [Pseudomonas citronellolis]